MGDTPQVQITLLTEGDDIHLRHVADGVFDNAINADWLRALLRDPRHVIAVANHGTQVVGFATAVHYFNPDKPGEMWINEIGVAPNYQRQGIGRALMDALLERGRSLGCVNAWVLTSADNPAAQHLYGSLGRAKRSEQLMYEFDLS